MTTNPPSEVKCCDGECNHDDCCGKIPENCTHKESPVSQSVVEKKECTAMTNHENWCDCGRPECWEEQLRLRVRFDRNQDREVCYLFIHRLLSTTLSTLVNEMEGKKKESWEEPMKDIGEIESVELRLIEGFNAGISAAVEVVKKMGV